jgi:hypothetical protein
MHGFEVQKYAMRISEINYSAFNRLVLGSSPRHPKSLSLFFFHLKISNNRNKKSSETP